MHKVLRSDARNFYCFYGENIGDFTYFCKSENAGVPMAARFDNYDKNND